MIDEKRNNAFWSLCTSRSCLCRSFFQNSSSSRQSQSFLWSCSRCFARIVSNFLIAFFSIMSLLVIIFMSIISSLSITTFLSMTSLFVVMFLFMIMSLSIVKFSSNINVLIVDNDVWLLRIRFLRRRIRREKIFQLQFKYSIKISRLLIRKLREFYKFVFSFKKRFKIVDFVFFKYFIVDRFFFVKIQNHFKSIRSVKQQWSEDFLSRTT